MAYRNLSAFLDELEALGELIRVRATVDPWLEIAEITDRVSKSPSGGKALLFESVRGSSFPVVTNTFGSFRRVCAALEVSELAELTGRMEELCRHLGTESVAANDLDLSGCPEFSRFAPLEVASAPCQEIVDFSPDLTIYPLLKNWAGDGRPDHEGRFITLPLVVTNDPESGGRNCGMYRVELFDGGSVGIHWRAGSGGAGHYRRFLARGERMPVAVAVGGDPSVIFAATVPLPTTIDEFGLAGFLRREKVPLVRCRTAPLMVPAEAEMVLEGYLEPGEEVRGGAFGNHTGFYAEGAAVPVMHVTCVTRRKEMVYPATVVGRPPMEDCYLAKATERLLLPLLRLKLPEIADINLPLAGIFHGCAIVALEKRHPGHPREVVAALWSEGWLAASRLLVVVDADLDLRDLSLVAWKVLNVVDWRHDVMIGEEREGAPLGRLALDATRKPTANGELREEINRGADIARLVENRWREYGI